MSRNQFILYAVLLVLLAVLGELYGSPRAYNIYEMFGR